MLVKDEVLLEALKAARHDAPKTPKPVNEVKSDVAETFVVQSEPITEKPGGTLEQGELSL